jgi:hypothetical protein
MVLVSYQSGGALSIDNIFFFYDRPINEDGERVPPSDLSAFRVLYEFRGPCCLCAFRYLDLTAYTETAILLCTEGQFVGEYIATCANDRCGYFGKVSSTSVSSYFSLMFYPVCLERMYDRSSLHVRRYSLRSKGFT